MNKILPLIIAFFALATPAMNICFDSTDLAPIIDAVLANKPSEQPAQEKRPLAERLKVLHDPIVIGTVAVAAILGPRKIIGTVIIYGVALNYEKIEPVAKELLKPLFEKWNNNSGNK